MFTHPLKSFPKSRKASRAQLVGTAASCASCFLCKQYKREVVVHAAITPLSQLAELVRHSLVRTVYLLFFPLFHPSQSSKKSSFSQKPSAEKFFISKSCCFSFWLFVCVLSLFVCSPPYGLSLIFTHPVGKQSFPFENLPLKSFHSKKLCFISFFVLLAFILRFSFWL